MYIITSKPDTSLTVFRAKIEEEFAANVDRLTKSVETELRNERELRQQMENDYIKKIRKLSQLLLEDN